MSGGLPDFSTLRLAVVGDMIADHYVYGSPRRLSREAPVLVLRHEGEAIGAGGAANVVRNLCALGAEVRAFGIVGLDGPGTEVRRLLEREGAATGGLVQSAEWLTPTKTRVLAAENRRFPQQVLRIDREPSGPAPASLRRDLAGRLRAQLGELDALLVSDYEYGLVDEELAEVALEFARAGKPCVLDPRRAPERYRGVTAFTPNVGELARFTDTDPDELDDPLVLARAAHELRGRFDCRYLLVTRGNLGMALFGDGLPPGGAAVAASGEGDVTDVSGAGDTAASVFALSLAAGLEPQRAMQCANAASGVVVMENGAAVCTRDELERALSVTPPVGALEGGPLA